MKSIRKSIALILCFALLISSLVISLNVSAVAMYSRHGYINEEGVNIRSGAGTSNDSLGKLNSNTKVLVNGVGFDANGARWYSLTAYTSSGNIVGFVHSDYVTVTGSDKSYEATTVKEATIRSAPGTWNDDVVKLPIGTKVTVIGTEDDRDGDMWYHVTFIYGGETMTGYAYETNVEILAEYVHDPDFEKTLNDQGFPESYKPYLRNLHALYPNWQFKADHLEMTFEEAVKGESGFGRSAVSPSRPDAWKSMAKDCYNWSSNSYKTVDSGGWVQASESVIRYYLDPRNFLGSTSVFQFISMEYDEKLHTKERVEAAIAGTFLAKDFPEKPKESDEETEESKATYETYADVLIAAAKDSGVSPVALASMILVEQGNSGGGNCISGKYPGYEGYYNFYNIRAYRSGNYNAIQYGLLYAKGGDGTRKTYYRPWNNRVDSIIGGAVWYAENYLNRGQDTLYYKKFNVVSKPYFSHEYMTNVEGASSEASKTASGYKAIMDAGLIFNIPVYKDMSAKAAIYPTKTGNNNCYLSSLTVTGHKLTPTFDKYVNEYEFIVSSAVTEITVNATASYSGANVEGAGKRTLKYGSNVITVTVTSTSGIKNDYNILVFRETPPEVEFQFNLTGYTADGSIVKGIKPKTNEQTLIANFGIAGGSAKIIKFDKTSTYIGTGDVIELYDNEGKLRHSYTLSVENDLSGDGKFSVIDIAKLQLHIILAENLSVAAQKSADLNGDGKISLVDLSLIQRKLLGIE